MAELRRVLITVTGEVTGDTHLARSYPLNDRDGNGAIELHRVPVHMFFLTGTDAFGKPDKREWKAPRPMPYLNGPKKPDPHYKSMGWVDAGLRSPPRRAVALYKPDYGTQNRYSPSRGVIQIKGSFLIHAGPGNLDEIGWGSAGCVEIVGNFDWFKNAIKELAGSNAKDPGEAILELVKKGLLFVQVDSAQPPDLRKAFESEVFAR